MAACPALGLLVTSNSDDNTLSVFTLPCSSGAGAAGLALVCTLGDASSSPPMQFLFKDDEASSGWMAFTGPPTARLLLLTDAGHDAVHVIDVVRRGHAGYVAAPDTIAGPRGVAARGSQVAVSAWKCSGSSDPVVHLFEGSGAMWTAVRVVGGGFGGPGGADGQLNWPHGLRFTGDGTGLAVADWYNDRVSVFRVEDGSFVRHVATGLSDALDVELCEAGWLVACYGSHTVDFVGDGGGSGGIGSGAVDRARLVALGSGDGELKWPTALALVPSLGLVVREYGNGGRLQVFATPDDIAMALRGWWLLHAAATTATHCLWLLCKVDGASTRVALPVLAPSPTLWSHATVARFGQRLESFESRASKWSRWSAIVYAAAAAPCPYTELKRTIEADKLWTGTLQHNLPPQAAQAGTQWQHYQVIPVGFRTSAAGALGCCADTAGSGVWVCTGERATIPPHKLSDEPIAYRRPHVVAVSRADVQRVSEGRGDAELPLWRNMAGLLEEAPDLGAVPWGYIGIVFDGQWRAEGAYAVVADQGVHAV